LLCETDWPKYDEKHLVQDKITLAIQVNGKLRATHDFSSSASEDAIKEEALSLSSIEKHIRGQRDKKIIIVPGRVVNIVAA
jgi:leucyl-tRNA synthetase